MISPTQVGLAQVWLSKISLAIYSEDKSCKKPCICGLEMVLAPLMPKVATAKSHSISVDLGQLQEWH